MSVFKCENCKSTEFVLTETVLTTSSFTINTKTNNSACLNSNVVTRQYTLTCVKCGQTYYRTENEVVDLQKSMFSGILVDVDVSKDKWIKGRQNK